MHNSVFLREHITTGLCEQRRHRRKDLLQRKEDIITSDHFNCGQTFSFCTEGSSRGQRCRRKKLGLESRRLTCREGGGQDRRRPPRQEIDHGHNFVTVMLSRFTVEGRWDGDFLSCVCRQVVFCPVHKKKDFFQERK